MAEAVLIQHTAGDQCTLSTSASIVYTASPAASASEPEKIVFQNNTAIDITVGASDVTDGANGVLLVASGNNSVTMHLRNPGEVLYAVAASGTPALNVVRIG